MEIVKREVRYAVHIPESKDNVDYHYVKEMLTFEDGSRKPNIRMIENYKKKVFVTKENKRNHKEKKEYERIENLAYKETTESDTVKTLAGMLGDNYLINYPNLINESPYVYGGDLTAASMIKLESLMENDFIQSPYTICGFDLETTTDNNKKILCGSIVIEVAPNQYKAYLLGMYDWLKEFGDEETIRHLLDKSNKSLTKDYGNVEIIFKLHHNEIDMLTDLFQEANKWAPDFLDIWNLDFDIFDVVIPTCKRHGVRVEDVVCDLRLPPELRVANFVRGEAKKKKSNGQVNPVNFADRWHKTECTAAFYIVDGMCTYRQLRIHLGKMSVSLENTAQRHCGIGKLSIKGLEHVDGQTWHDVMQVRFKIEYMIYNVVDNIALLMIDKKTKDLANSLPTYAEITPFSHYNGSDKKNYNALYIYGLSKGQIIGTGINTVRLKEKLGKKFPHNELYFKQVLDTEDWIQTVPQGNFLNVGMRIFKDFPHLRTNFRGNVHDIDSESSYPSATSTWNVSRSTTVAEIIEIEGYEPEVFRSQFLACVVGNTNAVEFCTTMFKLPTLEDWSNRINDGEFD